MDVRLIVYHEIEVKSEEDAWARELHQQDCSPRDAMLAIPINAAQQGRRKNLRNKQITNGAKLLSK